MRPKGRSFAITTTLAFLFLTALAPDLSASEDRSRAGHGRISLTYYFVRGEGYESVLGFFGGYSTDSHAYDLEVAYNVTDKWTVIAGIPLVEKRYNGPYDPLHDVAQLPNPRDSKYIDDGKYRTDLQDLRLSGSYRIDHLPVLIEPFVEAGIPSNDYVFFANSSVGQHLWRVAVGSTFSYSPPLSDFFFSLSAAYVFVEETVGVNINHVRFGGEVGYRFSPRFSARLFALGKEGNGLTLRDFPCPPCVTTDDWYHHDQTLRHNYVNAGAAIDLNVTNRLSVTAMYHTGIHHDEMTKVEYAYGLGLTRYF